MSNKTTKLSDIGAQFNKALSANVITQIIKQLESALSELAEMDTLLTDISRLNSSLSEDDLERISDKAMLNASKYGKSISDYLTSVKNAVQAGYENAEGIAELSTATQIAGNMTAELADQYILATNKAYDLNGSIENLQQILDGTNAIADGNFISMTDLAVGMSLAGETAADLGVRANEAAAAIATMLTATRQDGSETGEAFISILSNIEKIAEEAGIKPLQSPMETIKELAKLDISDNLWSCLTDTVGSGTNSNALHALLENYTLYENMLQQYADGSGSMSAEVQKTAENWEASLNQLSNTWTNTIGNLADSGVVTTAINGLNNLLSVVNSITDALGPVGTIAAISGGILSTKDVGRLKYKA